jgi:hypothetical protein
MEVLFTLATLSSTRHNVLWDGSGSPDVASDCGDFDECTVSYVRTNTLQINEGDVIHFKVFSGHDIYAVSGQAAYAACSADGPAIVPLVTSSYVIETWAAELETGGAGYNGPGTYLGICSVSNHCQLGQRIAITVVATAAPTAPSCPAFTCSAGTYDPDLVIGGSCQKYYTNAGWYDIGNSMGEGWGKPSGYATQQSCETFGDPYVFPEQGTTRWSPYTCAQVAQSMSSITDLSNCGGFQLSIRLLR